MDQETESSGLELGMYITFEAHLQGPLSNFQGHKYQRFSDLLKHRCPLKIKYPNKGANGWEDGISRPP